MFKIYNVSDFFKKFSENNITFDSFVDDVFNSFFAKDNKVDLFELNRKYHSTELKLPNLPYKPYGSINLTIPKKFQRGNYSKPFGKLYLPLDNDYRVINLMLKHKKYYCNQQTVIKIYGSRIYYPNGVIVKFLQMAYIVSDNLNDLYRFKSIVSKQGIIKPKNYCELLPFSLKFRDHLTKIIYCSREFIDVEDSKNYTNYFEDRFLKNNQNAYNQIENNENVI